MANAWWNDAWVDGVNVVKSVIRNGLRDFGVSSYANASEVQAYNLAGAKTILIGGVVYALDEADTTSTHNPPAVIVSLNGGRYKLSPAARERLSASRTYYVRTDGNDANTGLVNSAGGAFLTINRAITVAATLDLNGQYLIIQVDAGTYSGGAALKDPVGVAFAGQCILRGDITTPANVVIAGSVVADGIKTVWQVEGFRVGQGASLGVAAYSGSVLYQGEGIDHVATFCHVYAVSGAQIALLSDYKISGSAFAHCYCTMGSIIRGAGFTITLVGTPAFTYYAYAESRSTLRYNSMTFVGGATGYRYFANINSDIETFAGATYLPGSLAGILSSGGQYL